MQLSLPLQQMIGLDTSPCPANLVRVRLARLIVGISLSASSGTNIYIKLCKVARSVSEIRFRTVVE